MMGLIQWLSKVDPNVAIGVLSLVGTVAGWAYRKARGEQTSSFRETINAAVDSMAFEMFAEITDAEAARANAQGFLASVRARVEKHAWSVLEKRGVPRTALTERIVHEAIERASAMLARELAERRARVVREKAGAP
jgi:outer membrane murein-binding lipoprotein Lpp